MKKKHKIVVLTTLKDDLGNILKSTIKLAQTIDGEINVLNIQKPTEVVKKENQFSAVKSIYSKRISTDKKMRDFIDPFSKQYDMDINYYCSIGNIKNEISSYIKRHKPDIIVLGKRKPNFLKLIGDGITQYILNTYEGETLIIPSKNNLEPDREISLGTLNDTRGISNFKFSKQLLEQTKGPVKSFLFTASGQKSKEQSKNENNKTIDYVFEHNDSALEKLPNYISKNNINLLLLSKSRKSIDNTNIKQLSFDKLINKINVPLMVMGQRNIA